MINEQSEHRIACQKLIDAGFDFGWALSGEELILWEHEEDPPAPFKRP
jgi:hypothetical protein